MATSTTPKKKKKMSADKETGLEKIWQVLLFNCDCHTYQDVEDALIEAVGCTLKQAVHYALVAEQFGQVSIFNGSLEECKKLERPLVRIGLRSAVEPC